MDNWPKELATLRQLARCTATMHAWHTGVPICFWWLLSQYTLEGKRGNPSVILLMLGREKLLPLLAQPSRGHSHSPDPSAQPAQVLPSVLSS